MNQLTRPLALAAVLVVGVACSNAATTQSKSDAPTSVIPLPDPTNTGPVVQLPGTPAGAAAVTGPTLDDLYTQGKVEVVR